MLSCLPVWPIPAVGVLKTVYTDQESGSLTHFFLRVVEGKGVERKWRKEFDEVSCAGSGT